MHRMGGLHAVLHAAAHTARLKGGAIGGRTLKNLNVGSTLTCSLAISLSAGSSVFTLMKVTSGCFSCAAAQRSLCKQNLPLHTTWSSPKLERFPLRMDILLLHKAAMQALAWGQAAQAVRCTMQPPARHPTTCLFNKNGGILATAGDARLQLLQVGRDLAALAAPRRVKVDECGVPAVDGLRELLSARYAMQLGAEFGVVAGVAVVLLRLEVGLGALRVRLHGRAARLPVRRAHLQRNININDEFCAACKPYYLK